MPSASVWKHSKTRVLHGALSGVSEIALTYVCHSMKSAAPSDAKDSADYQDDSEDEDTPNKKAKLEVCAAFAASSLQSDPVHSYDTERTAPRL